MFFILTRGRRQFSAPSDAIFYLPRLPQPYNLLTERGYDGLYRRRFFGKLSFGRASSLSLARLCAGEGAISAADRRRGIGRGRGAFVSPVSRSRMGGIYHKSFGRADTPADGSARQCARAYPDVGHIFRAHLPAGRRFDGSRLFFGRRCGERCILCGARPCRPCFQRRRHLCRLCRTWGESALCAYKDGAISLSLPPDGGLPYGDMAGICGQRELPFLLRKARRRHLRGGRVRAPRRPSKGDRADEGRHDRRADGAPRLSCRPAGDRAAEFLQDLSHRGRYGTAVSVDIT